MHYSVFGSGNECLSAVPVTRRALCGFADVDDGFDDIAGFQPGHRFVDLTFPHPLRFLFAAQPQVLSQVLGVVIVDAGEDIDSARVVYSELRKITDMPTVTSNGPRNW